LLPPKRSSNPSFKADACALVMLMAVRLSPSCIADAPLNTLGR
jgi:hypothetical protein